MKKNNVFLRVLIFCFFFLIQQFCIAQITSVKGRVTNENKVPLDGVNIIVKQSGKGTTTNNDGEFTVALSAGDVLTISAIGYLSQEVKYNGEASISVVLKLSQKQLGEVIVIGYGTRRKSEITGSITSIKGERLLETPIANLGQGLQGRVAGLQVTQNSSAPGGNLSVRIRGTNSINGTSEPLYVIDGIQIANSGGINDVSPLSTINPNDIESIEVLKDASATAIYGARGANGVILISTKRGRNGATRITFDSYFGTQEITKKIEMLNASEFATLENQIYATTIYPDPASLGQGVNWQDLVYRKAPIQSHQLSITGGSEKTQLAISGNYFNQDGIVLNSNFKRYSLRANIDHKINDRIKIGTSILGSFSNNNSIPTGLTTIDRDIATASLVGAALGAPPTLQPYASDGVSILPFGNQFNGRYREVANPLGLAAILNQTAIKRTLANLYGEVKILEGLTYRASFNVDFQSNLNDFYSPRYIVNTSDLNAGSGTAGKGNSNSTLLLHESILSYAKIFKEIHSFKLTGVFATQSNLFNSNSITASGLPNDATVNEAVNLAVNRNVSSFRSKERLDSYLGRIHYGFKDRYFIDITGRVDGASKFGKNNKYGFFPAVSAAWRIIEEPFVKNISWLSDLKLRASYGVTGNAGAIGPYQSLALAGPGSNYQFNHIYTIGISPTGIANPDLKWEKSLQSDIGLDIGLFNNRVSFIIDAYYKKTQDLLFVKSLPLSSGYQSISGNFAGIENKGIEFATDAKIMDGKFKWNLSANLTINRNKVTDLDGGVTNEKFLTTQTIIKVGEPLGLFKTFVFDGIYQTGEPILPGSGSRTGGVKVRDINKDGSITSADQVIAGNPNPDFIFGFSTSFSYKNFDLSTFFTGSQGNDIYNLSRYSFENPLGQGNVVKGLVNRWSPANPSNEYVSGFQGGRLPISDRYMEDGSFIRCKNITLGYKFPAIKGIYNARVYISANNLFLISKYSGYDPEVNTYGNSNTTIGVDNLVYPNSRSFLAGIQVTF